MNESKTRNVKSKDTKLKILKTAVSLIHSRGINNVSVRDICREASISIGNFYHHFKSKDDLISSAHEQLDYLWESTIYEEKEERSCRDNILFLFDEAGRVMEDLGWEVTAQSYVHLLTSSFKYALKSDRPIYLHLHRVITKGLEKKEIPQETDIDDLSHLLVRTGRGILFDWCLMEGSYNLRERIRLDLSVILKGFL